MTFMLSLAATLQDYSMTDAAGNVITAEATGPIMSFSQMGVMAWPITFCLIMVVVLAARAGLRMQSGEREQQVLARATIDGGLFWGAYAVVLGVLGTVVGFMMAAQAVEAFGDVETRLVWGGVKVALSTTVYGLLIFLFSGLVWFGLRSWHRKAVLSAA